NGSNNRNTSQPCLTGACARRPTTSGQAVYPALAGGDDDPWRMPSQFREGARRSRLMDRKAARRRRDLDGRNAIVTRITAALPLDFTSKHTATQLGPFLGELLV